MGKRRTLSGNVGIGCFLLAFICTLVAFSSSSWLESDPRLTGAKFDRLGLWSYCFRSLPDPYDDYQRRFFSGCRWVYDPYTTGWDRIRGFLMPPFIIVTQLFYTLALIGVLASFILVLLFFLCFGPEQKLFVRLVLGIAVIMLTSGVCSALAVIVFAIWANKDDWMPGHDNNFFGWGFIVAIVGTLASLISGGLFLVETLVQRKKKTYLKESQSREERREINNPEEERVMGSRTAQV